MPAGSILAILVDSPAHLSSVMAILSASELARRSAPEEWAAVEILAHMRACSDVWGGCIMTLIAEDEPTIRAINPQTWIKQPDYASLPLVDSFRAFAAQRAELLAVLTALEPAAWNR